MKGCCRTVEHWSGDKIWRYIVEYQTSFAQFHLKGLWRNFRVVKEDLDYPVYEMEPTFDDVTGTSIAGSEWDEVIGNIYENPSLLTA